MKKLLFVVVLAVGLIGLFGCTVTVQQKVPVAEFIFSPENSLTLVTIKFDASYSHMETEETSLAFSPQGIGPDNSIIGYYWDFGDGIMAQGMIAYHHYIDDGIYHVTLTVTDNLGVSDHMIREVVVSNRAPLPNFESRYCPIAPVGIIMEPILRCVELDGRISRDLDGEINTYQWYNGSSHIGNGPVVRHDFVSGRVYYITLTVVDNDGAMASITLPVAVR